jgi:predicted alpha/beta superfamily hydrolase
MAISVMAFLNKDVFAQQPKKIFIGETVDIHSDILDEDRTLYIYTPAGYGSTNDSYPVLYMLDGADNFVHVSGIVHFLSSVGHIPQMILVAIPNTQRTRDLTPTHTDEFQRSGGGEAFLNFIDDELIPYIDSNYRTHPYRIIAGHSLAGLFVTYVLLDRPELFGGYIAISPTLGWDNGFILDRERSFFNKHSKLDKFLYITLGDEGERSLSNIEKFTATIKRTSPDGFRWAFKQMKNESHISIPHKSVYDGLELLYKDWAITDEVALKGLDSVLDHYRRLTDRFGYTVSPSEYYLNYLGYRFLRYPDKKEALDIFKYNVKLYPNSANVYDSYGEGLEQDGQLEKALENYQIAYTKGQQNSDPNENIFKQNYERLKSQLEE